MLKEMPFGIRIKLRLRLEYRVEATKINRSLLMLGIIISKLGQRTPPAWLPFRNSNLTRLLQQSFGGNSRTLVLGTINPSMEHVQDTEGTLRFASRAMQVENVYAVNHNPTPVQKLRQLRQDSDKLVAPVLQRKIVVLEKEVARLATEVRSPAGINGMDCVEVREVFSHCTGQCNLSLRTCRSAETLTHWSWRIYQLTRLLPGQELCPYR